MEYLLNMGDLEATLIACAIWAALGFACLVIVGELDV